MPSRTPQGFPAILVALALAAPARGRADAPEGDAAPLPSELSGLKERISRARARPGALRSADPEARETARAVVLHVNEMGPAFQLESITYRLDGATVYAKLDVDGDLASRREFEVWSGELAPGAHELVVHLVYRGVGEGLSRFWDGHRFEVDAAHRFGAAAGQLATVRIAGYERTDRDEVPERPAVRFTADAAPIVAPAPEPAAAQSR